MTRAGFQGEPGAYSEYAVRLADRELNLSKLESRPFGDEPWQYRFYLDVESGRDDPAFREALDELREQGAAVQVLGSYPRWRA